MDHMVRVLASLELLKAVREDDTDRAVALLVEHPQLAASSIRTAFPAGEPGTVQALSPIHLLRCRRIQRFNSRWSASP